MKEPEGVFMLHIFWRVHLLLLVCAFTVSTEMRRTLYTLNFSMVVAMSCYWISVSFTPVVLRYPD